MQDKKKIKKTILKANSKTNKNKFILPILFTCLLILLPLVIFEVYYWDKIYPGVKVAGIEVSNLTIDDAAKKLNANITQPSEIVIVSSTEQKFTIPTTSISLNYDYAKSAQSAYLVGRSGSLMFDVKEILNTIRKGKNSGLKLTLNEQELQKNIDIASSAVEIDTIYPSATLQGDNIIINPGKAGIEVDKRKLRIDVGEVLSQASNKEIVIEKMEINPQLTPSEELTYRQRLEKIKTKSLKLTFNPKDNIFSTFDFSKNTLVSFVSPKGGYNSDLILKEIVKISENVNRPAQNPTFEFSEGRVKEFSPAKDGIEVKMSETKLEIENNLQKLESTEDKELSFEVPVTRTLAEIKTGEVNDLGIKELIGRGTSTFRGSIPSRIHNVAHATSKINGVLIKPGETFSFNNALGDISKATGFQEAYVIQNGRTVLGDGGGVCQVSTTLFRAAMNTGLPIVERHNHSYRVGYYEQDAGAGLDATVFSPSADFKFKNDTPGHVLIQAKADTKNLTLVFELYGTSDGRVATVTKPKFLSQTPPPADVYQDDPTLKVGVVKQVEHRASGAKTVFDYTVTRNGQEIYKKTFTSVYKPWAAVYLKGTAI